MKVKAVPPTLLPLSDWNINESWAIQTYQYRRVFNYNLVTDDVSSKDLVAWIKEARLLTNELREYGTTKAEEYIVKICQHYYDRQLKEYFDSDFSIKNMYGVAIVKNFVHDFVPHDSIWNFSLCIECLGSRRCC